MGYGLSGPERHTERRNPFGRVWIVCPYPVVARGLERHLQGEARVHLGQEPPQDQAPSSIIFCPNGNEDEEEVASGVERLRGAFPQAPVLVFDSRLGRRVAGETFRSGASGYLHAGMRPAQVLEAVSLASAGEVVIPREVLKGLVEKAPEEGAFDLTPRQREILGLVAEGLTNAEIAGRLYLSEFTVKQHLRKAYKALNVKNRTEAARVWSGLEGPVNS